MSNIQKVEGYLGGGSQPAPQSRTPVEAPEGIQNVFAGEDLAVSLTEIEVLDLISEGEIEGLVSGEYTYLGTLGQTGWSSGLFAAFPPIPPVGESVRWLRSIYWNEVPVVGPTDDGEKFNFQSVQTAFTPGLPNGANIRELNNNLQQETTITRPINERLRFGDNFAKTYRVLNRDVKSVQVNIRFNILSEVDTNQGTYGDTLVSTVLYDVLYRPLYINPKQQPVGFVKAKSEDVTGKVSYGYMRTTQIDFYNQSQFNDADLDAILGWEIKIVRNTEDSITSAVRNQTFVDSLTELYGDIFVYPNTAMVASKFNAEYFSQIPARAFDVKLLKVQIPNNYDPITRSYVPNNNAYDEDGNSYTTPSDGSWDGDWKRDANGKILKQWTDNPAWCFYDLITNKRYGLGNHIEEQFTDKWTLFEIAQYCDVLVSDGRGGLEPRFSSNMILTSREEAYKVVNDVASIFRAINYFAVGSIYSSQDAKKNSIYEFTNANVKGGNFSYSSSSRRVRHSVATVRYNDKTDFYKPAIEYIEDVGSIKKYGIREIELTAFGTTSRGQALRLGRWALLSENLETETVTFVAGLEANYLRPGDVFKITDRGKTIHRFAGRTDRIANLNGSGVAYLDDKVTGISAGEKYKFNLLTPTYFYEPSSVSITSSNDINDIRRNQVQSFYFDGGAASISNNKTEIVFTPGFNTGSYDVTGQLIWSIEPSGETDNLSKLINSNNSQLYRAIKIAESEPNEYEIVGISYADDKFAKIESGLQFGDDEVGLIPTGPTAIQLTERRVTDNTSAIDYSFVVPNLSGVSNYFVYIKDSSFSVGDFDNNTYLNNILPRLKTNDSYVPLIDGTYYFRVYSVNQFGFLSSSYAEDSIQIQNINPIKDLTIHSLTEDTVGGNDPGGSKSGISITRGSPTFTWETSFAEDTSLKTNFTFNVSIREQSGPSNNVPSNNIYFEVTGYNPNNPSSLEYQFAIADNIAAVSTLNESGPFREYDVVVYALDASGNSSAGSNFSNSNGYDIVEVNNEYPPSIVLNGKEANDIYSTSCWISPDGEVKIGITEESNYDEDYFADWIGGYVYTSSGDFTESEAKGLIPTSKAITRSEFTQLNNPIVIPANLTGVSEAYIGISVYDAMGQATKAQGQDIEDDLNFSNVVRIVKEGGYSLSEYQ